MKNSFLTVALLIVSTVFGLSHEAKGWGDIGHSVVGDVADRLLNVSTRVKVRKLLRGQTLAEAATWPDLMRSDPSFGNTDIGNWHFYTLDNPASPPPMEGVNAVWAIEKMLKIISGEEGSYEVPKKKPEGPGPVVIDKAKAIAFLTHFVGDLHQPHHVGNSRDRGANLCIVKWFGEVRRREGFWNLHSVWDEGIVEAMEMGRGDLTLDVLRRLDATPRESILAKKTAMEWAKESAEIRASLYPQVDPKNPKGELEHVYCANPTYKDLPGKYAGQGEAANVIDYAAYEEFERKIFSDPTVPRLGYDYRYQHVLTAKMQLLKAGVRLAYLLDRAVTPARDVNASKSSPKKQ